MRAQASKKGARLEFNEFSSSICYSPDKRRSILNLMEERITYDARYLRIMLEIYCPHKFIWMLYTAINLPLSRYVGGKTEYDTNLSEWWSSFNKVHSLIYLVHDLAQNSILPVYNESNCHSALGDPSSIDFRNASDRRNNLHLRQRFGRTISNWHFQCAFKFRTIENEIGDEMSRSNCRSIFCNRIYINSTFTLSCSISLAIYC